MNIKKIELKRRRWEMPKMTLNINVFDAAIERLKALYEDGHRVVVSFSGGKDSGVCLELCRIAAKETGRLPVDAVHRDEEIMAPGTFEYVRRMYHKKDVNLRWIIAGQPIINCFNRKLPYWWVFDPNEKDKWVRPSPPEAEWVKELNIEYMTIPERFPPAEGKKLFAVIGLRTCESRFRKMGLISSGNYITRNPNRFGVYNCRPIYDMSDDDVWKAIYDNKWDYNEFYDVMHRLGANKNRLRVAPPTMTAGIESLKFLLQAYPKWFDKMEERVPGVRTAAQYGKRCILPIRRLGETWKDCNMRIYGNGNSPQWIVDRWKIVVERTLAYHNRHSTLPFPDTDFRGAGCPRCYGTLNSWKKIAESMYMGDCFSQKATFLPQVEPELFREGAGTWGGKASW